MALRDAGAKLLMTTPSVGAIVALTYAAAIDDPKRFRSSKATGAHFGLTQKKYQSGETDITGRISKIGDKEVRCALYEAAHVMLTRPTKASKLKTWARQVPGRAGMRKAKVALARRLAVVLHRMLADGVPFNPDLGGPVAKACLARRSNSKASRKGHRHQLLPSSERPIAGTMDQVRPQLSKRRPAQATALL